MHIAIVPDGNRRNEINLTKSYTHGIDHLMDFLKWCKDFKVNEVTAYCLSIENLEQRERPKLKSLLNLFSLKAVEAIDDKIDAKINVCGDMQLLRVFNEDLVSNLMTLEHQTRKNKKFTLNLAIAYGGQQEIMHAIRSLSMTVMGSHIQKKFEKNLWIKSNPDIIIRTSQRRLSNFLLWQSAYSEFYYVDKLWQDFNKADLKEIIDSFNKTDRRFGR